MKRRWVLGTCVGLLLGCGSEPGTQTEDVTQKQSKLCAAVRGNGPKIPAHFGALARAHEHYGLLWGMSGGSSGSITTFMVESMYLNPQLDDCGGKKCTSDESAARAALMLKSFQAYLSVLADTEEGQAFAAGATLAQRLKDKDVESLLASDPQAGLDALQDVLGSEDLAALINPEVLELLQSSPDPVAHAQDLVAALQMSLAFQVDSEKVFLRPGLIDFGALAQKLGRVGSFYAGYGPHDAAGTERFFAACATPGRGKEWKDVAKLPAGEGTCGDAFAELLGGYRAKLLADEASHPSRIDDEVGAFLPVLVSTSLLEGESVEMWRSALDAYRGSSPIAWTPSFDDVKVGYFGLDADLDRVLENRQGYEDLKTNKATAIRGATWAVALSTSPAEPGLARGIELEDGRVSIGGWPDLYPVQALKNLGCDEVLYVTREGGMIGSFADQVASRLGMSAEEREALYSLRDDSSFTEALVEADAVWCTDWDIPATSDVQGVLSNAWNAPLESSDPFFTKGKNAYPGVEPDLGKPGCSAGVAE
jgi:hypothetical protein